MLHSIKINTLDFSGLSIYAGMDVHNESWRIFTPLCPHRKGLRNFWFKQETQRRRRKELTTASKHVVIKDSVIFAVGDPRFTRKLLQRK